MKLTIVYQTHTSNLELDGSIEIENLKALLEAELDVPKENQILIYKNAPLLDEKKTLDAYNILDNSIIILEKGAPANLNQTTRGTHQSHPPPPLNNSNQANVNPTDTVAIENIRQQVLSDPAFAATLEQIHPGITSSARNSPQEFTQTILKLNQQRYEQKLQKQLELEALNADPFNIEAQKKIEEAIRMENIHKNMEDALENNPELFGSVTMLYIDSEVNQHHVKAFVDSGAQATIMSLACAKRSGLERLMDTRFTGVAVGVGTAKIIGRIHNTSIKVGNQYLVCSFTVIDGQDMDLLFGLDMLKRHQACIDLKKNALVINGQEIPFLPEHQIPKRNTDVHTEKQGISSTNQNKISDTLPSSSNTSTNPFASLLPGNNHNLQNSNQSSASTSNQIRPFVGEGRTLSSSANISQPAPPRPSESLGKFSERSIPASANRPESVPSSKYPEDMIKTLMSLGATREKAIMALDASEGNIDLAAGFLFDYN
ncbi:hypothetical protein BB559_001638 [Furculomyces boomerangus]|uniref:DNA damage-inducible protein 1 n=2 Tax=Harpellales TaxID=61421 RepID=A0A2T9Z1F2_9FUNG|nr:hypothetical protein BB559_001638 [Furculomyces boomerangus]PVZ98889.1 hypothetical protein BB558_005113 [Smittium angustum]